MIIFYQHQNLCSRNKHKEQNHQLQQRNWSNGINKTTEVRHLVRHREIQFCTVGVLRHICDTISITK